MKLNVIREYFRLVEGKKGDRIVYDLQPLTGALKVGDLLGVRMTVSGTKWQYTIAEDPIPSGAEFVSRDDLYELRDPRHWWNNFYTISPGKGETWKQNETFCRYLVGNQSHPIKPGRQSEASLACLRGDFWA